MTIAVRERPILLSGFWVRQALAGRKSQTRRVVFREPGGGGMMPDKCPYGAAGDQLWVRESWQLFRTMVNEGGGSILPWLGKVPLGQPANPHAVTYAADFGSEGPWRPSIHMPRWASRLLLEVTGVRIERLQDISQKDAEKEGMPRRPDHSFPRNRWRSEWKQAWDVINGRRGHPWQSNPWVWVVSFEVLEIKSSG